LFHLYRLPTSCFHLWNYFCMHRNLWRQSWTGIKRNRSEFLVLMECIKITFKN
jgi:hypothetical protein